ncbi:hypothetical protein ACFVXH_39500 [Kitasatospora sp. NPDC058184]|uniref:hypothetical protein n=1 Tax=Kitasatospora sp. NPDC058184 TaxID=3346370 RepID=UPI0036DC6129
MSSQQSATPPNRRVWVLVAILASLLVAVVVGILTSVQEHSISAAFLAGLGAFGTAVAVSLVVFTALGLT